MRGGSEPRVGRAARDDDYARPAHPLQHRSGSIRTVLSARQAKRLDQCLPIRRRLSRSQNCRDFRRQAFSHASRVLSGVKSALACGRGRTLCELPVRHSDSAERLVDRDRVARSTRRSVRLTEIAASEFVASTCWKPRHRIHPTPSEIGVRSTVPNDGDGRLSGGFRWADAVRGVSAG